MGLIWVKEFLHNAGRPFEPASQAEFWPPPPYGMALLEITHTKLEQSEANQQANETIE
jgi:hypothetical protein